MKKRCYHCCCKFFFSIFLYIHRCEFSLISLPLLNTYPWRCQMRTAMDETVCCGYQPSVAFNLIWRGLCVHWKDGMYNCTYQALPCVEYWRNISEARKLCCAELRLFLWSWITFDFFTWTDDHQKFSLLCLLSFETKESKSSTSPSPAPSVMSMNESRLWTAASVLMHGHIGGGCSHSPSFPSGNLLFMCLLSEAKVSKYFWAGITLSFLW